MVFVKKVSILLLFICSFSCKEEKSSSEKVNSPVEISKENLGEQTDASIEVISSQVSTSAKVDTESIGEIKGYIDEELPTIFNYYQIEMEDEVAIWSDKMFGRCCTEVDLSYSELLEFAITASPNNSAYPASNLSDKAYRTAYVFEESQDMEIILKLKRNEETHKHYTNLLVDDVLKPNDTLLNPFKLSLVNGYTKSKKAFDENGRVKEMKLFLNNNYIGDIKLLDTALIQEFEFDIIFSKNDAITLKPVSYYKGSKYDDICISEIQSSLAHITHPSINKKYKINELRK